MPIEQRCWNCRWRRLQCDLQRPSCSKCTRKGLPCPGYAPEKPLRWRHRVVGETQQDPSPPELNIRTPQDYDDVAPAHVIVDALAYYNSSCAPDLAADGSLSPYTIDLYKWADFSKSKRHLCLCLVTLHRAVRKYGSVSENQALFHYHQACAAEMLNHNIQILSQAGPSPELFEDVSLFFFSQIQASAYGAWRAHLNAAKTLFNLWGVENLVGNSAYELHLCHLVRADVFGTTMAPASHISAEEVVQQRVYLNLLEQFKVDICGTLVPIPEVVVRATILINIIRAEVHSLNAQDSEADQKTSSSLSAILELLQEFDPLHWVSHLPSHTSSQANSWALLATCFQTAAILYLIQTCALYMNANGVHLDEDIITPTYNTLSTTTRKLFELRQHGGVHYKYILWPMVMCGMLSVTRKDEEQLQFLCESLERTTMDLGTLSMREAAVFLQELWESCTQSTTGSTKEIGMDWDAVFHRAPLFLL